MITETEQLSVEQAAALDKYLAKHCTSRCFNDQDCPHIEDFISSLNESNEKQN